MKQQHYNNGGERGPNHRQCVLLLKKARVKETNTRNHNPDESHGGSDPGYVAKVVDNWSAIGTVGNQATSWGEAVRRTIALSAKFHSQASYVTFTMAVQIGEGSE